jgi:hypothetical protein
MTGTLFATRISEQMTTIASSSAITCSYLTSGLFYVTANSTNFTCNITDVPTTANQSYGVTLVIYTGASQTNLTYATTVTVNGTTATMYYNGGSANVSITAGTRFILQQIVILLASGASPTSPTCVFSTISIIY